MELGGAGACAAIVDWLVDLIRTHFTVDDCSVAARCAH